MRAKDVNQEDVEKVMRALKKIPIRANRTLSCLSKMFNLAEEWKVRESHTNPCRFVKKYEEKPREWAMSTLELEALGLELEAREGDDPVGVAALRLLVFTGSAHRGAVIGMGPGGPGAAGPGDRGPQDRQEGQQVHPPEPAGLAPPGGLRGHRRASCGRLETCQKGVMAI